MACIRTCVSVESKYTYIKCVHMFVCRVKNGWPKYETFENNHCSLCSYLLFPLHVVHQTKKQNTRTREAQTATSCFCLCAKSEMWHGRRKRNKNTGVFFLLCSPRCTQLLSYMFRNESCCQHLLLPQAIHYCQVSAERFFFRIRKNKMLSPFPGKVFQIYFFLIALIFCMLAHVVTCIFFRSFANYILSLKSDS